MQKIKEAVGSTLDEFPCSEVSTFPDAITYCRWISGDSLTVLKEQCLKLQCDYSILSKYIHLAFYKNIMIYF